MGWSPLKPLGFMVLKAYEISNIIYNLDIRYNRSVFVVDVLTEIVGAATSRPPSSFAAPERNKEHANHSLLKEQKKKSGLLFSVYFMGLHLMDKSSDVGIYIVNNEGELEELCFNGRPRNESIVTIVNDESKCGKRRKLCVSVLPTSIAATRAAFHV